MIRPSAVHLCATDCEDCQVVGSVTDVAFRGRGYEHAVQLADGGQVTGIFHHARFARGDVVGLSIESNGCMAFSSQETADASDPDETYVPNQAAMTSVETLDALAVAK